MQTKSGIESLLPCEREGFSDKLNAYFQDKEKLISLLAVLEKLLDEEQHKNYVSLIRNKLISNQFYLVVIGQFKRGKSKFINALLGEDLLPTAIVPLTSIITVIRYSERVNIKVIFKDGRTECISREALPLFITEKSNPNNHKNVELVEIGYPAESLKNGVCLVDTPGIASVYEHNTEMTYSFLSQADAAILLVSGDPPITEAERQFLLDIKDILPPSFFVLNKIDQLTPVELKESLDFTSKVIKSTLGITDITIYPVSAKVGLEAKLQKDNENLKRSGLAEFETRLEDFLTNTKGKTLLISSINKSLGVITQELLTLQLEQKSLNTSLNELDERLRKFGELLKEVEQDRLASQYLLDGEVKESVKKVLQDDLNNLRNTETHKLIRELGNYYEKLNSPGNKNFVQSLDIFLKNYVCELFNKFRVKEEIKLQQNLKAVLKNFSNRTNSLFEKVLTLSAKIFELPTEEFKFISTLSRDSQFDFRLEEPVSVHLDNLIDTVICILPRPIAHKIILRKMQKRAEMLIDMHCGRLHYDISERVNQTVNDFKLQIEQAISAIAQRVYKSIEVGQHARLRNLHEITALNQQLEMKIQNLLTIKTELSQLEHKLTK
ncbi:MAG: dynamin family protein [Candidatus Sumerlaeia bacterium]|nr:dynamin family protein [Candidatus Sumerlaeia bacterium]